MKKRFTMLLASLLLVVGTAWADSLGEGVYTIVNKAHSRAISENSSNNKLLPATQEANDYKQLWLLSAGENGGYTLRNAVSGRYMKVVEGPNQHWVTSDSGTELYIAEQTAATGDAPAYYYISMNETPTVETGYEPCAHDNNWGNIVGWTHTADASQWAFTQTEIAMSVLVDNLLAADVALAEELDDNAVLNGSDEYSSLTNAVTLAKAALESDNLNGALDAMLVLKPAVSAAQLYIQQNDISYITALEYTENSNHPVLVNNARSNWGVADNATALKTLAQLGLAKSETDTKQQFAFITPDGGTNYYLYSVHAQRYLKNDNTFAAQGEPVAFADASTQGANKIQVRFRDVAQRYFNVGGDRQMTIDWWSEVDDGNACEIVQYNTLEFDLDYALKVFNKGAEVTIKYMHEGAQVLSQSELLFVGDTKTIPCEWDYTTIESVTVDGVSVEAPAEGNDWTFTINAVGPKEVKVNLVYNTPFALTVENDTTWHMLKIRPSSGKWVKMADEAPYPNKTERPTDDKGLWAFTGDPINGIQVLNKAVGKGKTLSFDATDNKSNIYMKEETTTWTLGKGNGGFTLRYGAQGNKYAHDMNSKLQFWDNSSASGDAGSALVAVSPLTIKYMLGGVEQEDLRVEATDYDYGTEVTIANPYANKYIAIGGIETTGSQPELEDDKWSVTVTKETELTVTLVEDLPFEYADSKEKITQWYYLKFHAIDRNYLYYAADGEVLKTDKTAVDGDKDAYTWAFVGDPVSGFKVYNKKAAKYLDAVESGAVVGADQEQVFTLTSSSYAPKGFFMQAKDGDYTQRFNKNDGKVLYWSGADAGSTFIVELRPKEGFAAAEELLAANVDNHSNEPVLGQYTTAAYNALKEANEDPNATAESIEEAIVAFKASLNRPVYLITSAWNDGYPAGSAIYYDGVWKWKEANKFDRQMWMTIPGYTDKEVPSVQEYNMAGTHYGLCDYLTGTKMRGLDVQIVTISGWPEAYNLQYGTNEYDAAMHAADTRKLVGWNAATLSGNMASAWKVEYLGNSYSLSKLTEEKLEALAGLQAAFDSKSYLANATFGNGIGQYQGSGEAVSEAFGEAAPILYSNLNVMAEEAYTVEKIQDMINDLNALELTINMPEDGKYYRIWGANSNVNPAGHYITNHTNYDGGRIALTEDATNATTIYQYKDGKLQAYENGKYIGLSSSHWTFADDAASASEIVFAASSYVAGAYTIKSADRYLRYKVYDGEAEIDRTESEGSANDAWFLQEIETKTITYIYKAGKSELARQEVKGFIGLPYPAADATLPLGYVAPATLDGTVAENETEKVIACAFDKSQMPFQYADSYENIEHWYYLNIAANGYYLYHADGADHIALNKTAVDANNKDAYSWAFIGNPTDGFQIVNRAKGEGWILSSSTTMDGTTGSDTWPIMTELANLPSGNNTDWIHTKSTNRANRDGFYLEQKGHSSNKMNNRSSKLAYWTGGADAGSTLVAVEQYEMTQTYSGVGSWEVSPVYPEGLKTGAASGSHGNAAKHVGANGHTIYKSTKAIVTTEADVTVSFNYATGDHGLITLGVDVVNGNGDVVASDYHVGFTGGAQDNKLYTLRNLPAGNYILRCYVCNKDDGTDHHLGSTGGNIVVNFAKELTDVDAVSTMWETLNKTGQSVLAYKGEGLGYYNNTEDVEVKIAVEPEKTVSGYTAAFVALDDAIDNAYFALPEAGKFYRFSYDYGDAGVKYVQAVASGVENKTNSMVMTEDQGAASIFYYADGKLLSYSAGQYVRDEDSYRGLQPVGAAAGAASFTASTVPGKLYIFAGASFHANKSNDVYFVDHCGSGHNHNLEHNFTVEEVRTLPVTVTAVGYATFYAPVGVRLPDGIAAYAIEEGKITQDNEDGTVKLSDPIRVIPANTGVILYANGGGDFELDITNTKAQALEGNLLSGASAKTLVKGDAYVLANKDRGIGLYPVALTRDESGATGGTTHFLNGANKAYLPKSAITTSNVRSLIFRFGDTGVEDMQAVPQHTLIYDLMGRPVERMEKGIYIVNGRKVVK